MKTFMAAIGTLIMAILMAFGATVASIFLLMIVLLCLTFPAQWLWNNIATVIFGLPNISYWQMLGLMILSTIMFRGLGFGAPQINRKKPCPDKTGV